MDGWDSDSFSGTHTGDDGTHNSPMITPISRPVAEDSLRERCAKIAAIEAHYWGEVDDERISLIAIGAMGAAANICAAIMRELTPEQHRAECDARGEK